MPLKFRSNRKHSELAHLEIMQRGLTVYRVAFPGWKVMWNDYSGQKIGFGVVTGPVCWSFRWGRM